MVDFGEIEGKGILGILAVLFIVFVVLSIILPEWYGYFFTIAIVCLALLFIVALLGGDGSLIARFR